MDLGSDRKTFATGPSGGAGGADRTSIAPEDENRVRSPLRGVIPPILTPLRNGHPDLPSLRHLLERTHRAGCSAVCLGGTVGWGTMLTDEDWISVMVAAAEWSDQRVPLIAGVMETSTARAIQRIRRLAALGFRGYLLTPTYYVTPRRSTEFYRHFAECRAASEIEMLLYDVPSCTGASIPTDVLEACFREGLCRGIKDSSGDLDAFVLKCEVANRYGGSALMGGRPDLAWLRQVGAGGMVPVPANLAPEPFVAGWRAAESGNLQEMARQQSSIDRLWAALVTPDDWMRGTIYAVSRQGLGDGTPLPPLDSLDFDRRATIDALVGKQDT